MDPTEQVTESEVAANGDTSDTAGAGDQMEATLTAPVGDGAEGADAGEIASGAALDADLQANLVVAADAPPPAPDPSLYGANPGASPVLAAQAAAPPPVDDAEESEDELAQEIDVRPPAAPRRLDSIADTLVAVGHMVNAAEIVNEAIARQARTTSAEPEVGVLLQRISVAVGDFRNAVQQIEGHLTPRLHQALENIARGR